MLTYSCTRHVIQILKLKQFRVPVVSVIQYKHDTIDLCYQKMNLKLCFHVGKTQSRLFIIYDFTMLSLWRCYEVKFTVQYCTVYLLSRLGIFLRPLLSCFGPFAAPSRPLTAPNFPRPLKIFYGYFWAKGPWPRPPGNPEWKGGGRRDSISEYLVIHFASGCTKVLPIKKISNYSI
jgi:hypothetical protein